MSLLDDIFTGFSQNATTNGAGAAAAAASGAVITGTTPVAALLDQNGDPITADSEPNCDGWGPDSYWSCADWITWHKALLKKYDAVTAANKWATAFDNCAGYLGHEINCASKNDDFKTYVIDNGLVTKSTKLTQVSKAIAWGDSVHQPIADLGSALTNVTGAVKNATGSVVTIATWLPWVLLVGAVVVAGIIIFNQTEKTATA